jgi:hypothetical protein
MAAVSLSNLLFPLRAEIRGEKPETIARSISTISFVNTNFTWAFMRFMDTSSYLSGFAKLSMERITGTINTKFTRIL